MDRFLPEYIDPYRYADQGLSLDHHLVKISDLERLKSLVNSPEGSIKVNLTFGVDKQGEQNITFVKGHIETTLKLQCQRCMEPFNYEIMSDFLLGIIQNLDEVSSLPEQYEPAVAKDNSLALRDLIEDEVILNLPIIPRHEPDQCNVKMPYSDAGWEDTKGQLSPFHVLASLKDKDKRQ